MNDSQLLADYIQQEEISRFVKFSHDDGWALGMILRRLAIENKAPVAMEVFAFGQQVFLAALPGSCPENLEWIRRKRNTVLRSWKASLHVGAVNRLSGQRMEQQGFIQQSDYCDHGGGFPIRLVDGVVIGAVTVSGLPEQDDHALVVRAIQALLRDAAC